MKITAIMKSADSERQAAITRETIEIVSGGAELYPATTVRR
jgi:F0F1-type ATP synthase gamma subunit